MHREKTHLSLMDEGAMKHEPDAPSVANFYFVHRKTVYRPQNRQDPSQACCFCCAMQAK